jgi:1-deoxy-D-xylulose-5-phosphate synthase
LIPLLQLGLPDAFVDHGDPAQLLATCALDARGIVASVSARFGQRRSDPLAKPAA